MFLIDSLMPGGTETQMLYLADNLPRDRYESVIGVLQESSHRMAKSAASELVSLGAKGNAISRKYRILKNIRNLIRERQIDIVQTHFEESAIFAALVKIIWAHKTVLVGTRRNLYHWAKARPVAFWLYKLTGRVSSRVLANSSAVMSLAVKLEGLNKNKLLLIQNGIDISRFEKYSAAQARTEFGLPKDGKIVGAVGNWRPIKGMSTFLDAAGQVAECYRDTHFVLAGIGPQKQELMAQARRLGIGDRTTFVEGCTDIERLLPAFDVAVHPSYSESFSNVLIEYMAAGKPVVATRVGDAEQVIEEGVDGFLVPPGDAAAISGAVIQILENHAESSACGRRAAEKVRKLWSWPSIMDKYDRFYSSLVHSG